MDDKPSQDEVRIRAVMEEMIELNDALGDLRQQAAALGVKPPALNPFVAMAGANPQDKGQAMVLEFIRLARIAGLDLGGAVDTAMVEADAATPSPDPAAPTPPAETAMRPPDRRREWTKLARQLGFALAVTGVLLWWLR